MTDTHRTRDTQAAPAGRGLKANSLGVLGILFFVLSAQAPLTGIAGAAPIATAIGNGAGVPMSYVGAGLVVLLFSIGFVAMGRHVVRSGAFYAYVGHGLGLTTGTAAAGVALFAYASIQACMYGLYGASVSGLVDHYVGLDLDWWVWALLTMAVIQALGALGIELGVKVLALFVSAEFALLGIFAIITLFEGGGSPDGLDVAGSFGWDAAFSGAPGVALSFAIAAMFGFEATAIYGEEAREPRKTVPRATYLAVAVVTIFFAFVSWMLVAYYGSSDAQAQAGAALEGGDQTVWVSNALADQMGDWAGDAVGILLATSLFAGMLAFHNSITRYLYSLSRDGVIHPGLSVVNARRAPARAGTVQTISALLLVMPFAILDKDPVLTLFSWGSGVAVLAMLCLYLLTGLSVLVFFRREPSGEPMWSTRIAPVLSVITMAGAVWLIVDNFRTLTGGSESTAFWLVASVPVVFLASLAWAVVRRERINPDSVR
jgi:amino acid transporter